MKYIKKFESKTIEDFSSKTKLDILYLAQKQGAGEKYGTNYILETINYYNLNDEQIHNLRLAVEYRYLHHQDFRTIINDVIHFGYIGSSDHTIDRRFKMSFEKNFKSKIIKIKKPYPICVETYKGLNSVNDLNSFQVNDIIGEIPKEYPFNKKYVIGMGRYRGDNEDGKCLWEKFKNTTRESEFIRVIDENEIYILTKEDIERVEIQSQANKYNI